MRLYEISIILNEDELVTKITLNKLREPGSEQLKLYNEDDMLVALAQLGYNHWQGKEEPSVDSYNQMVDLTLKLYGEIPAFALLVKNYIGQVYNGGHAQYWGNGYASEHSIGAGNYSPDDMGTHKLMMKLMKKIGVIDFTKETRELYRIMNEFVDSVFEYDDEEDTCPECNGTGTVERLSYNDETDEEEEEIVDCPECDGSGQGPNPQYYQSGDAIVEAAHLDSELYKIGDSLINALNYWLRSNIKKKFWKKSQ